jgi:hypothetical protein
VIRAQYHSIDKKVAETFGIGLSKSMGRWFPEETLSGARSSNRQQLNWRLY